MATSRLQVNTGIFGGLMPYMSSRERRHLLVEAAARAIAKVGLEDATTRVIAAEAGAPLGILHYAFKDKGELLDKVYEHMLDHAKELLERQVVEGCGLPAGVRAITWGYLKDALQDEGMLVASYEVFFWSARRQLSRHPAEVYAAYRVVCAQALQRSTGGLLPDATAADMAQFLMIATDGVVMQYLSERDVAAARTHLEVFAEAAIQLYAPDMDGSGAHRDEHHRWT